ncbi:axonemal dynein light intermediate polypeptide 1-like [Antennarius striatus]|uniref:axonemal dynein light intermediate polypeptide 1-like n=1 Tax=Antennarius striatus TaxID=241820 RepID=UPI0035B08FF7
MITPPKSLLKYENPVLIRTTDTSKDPSSIVPPSRFPDGASTSTSLDILNAILPPREWMQDNQLWVQHVSSAPCTRMEVVQLEEHLYRQLRQRQAKEVGICPIRRELYSQCFDELIRQVTTSCAERGLLLRKVQIEINSTLDTYQTLHESSIAYAIRKAFQAVENKAEVEQRNAELLNRLQDLQNQLKMNKARCDEIEREAKEEAENDKEVFMAEINDIMEIRKNLKAKLEETFVQK